MTASGLTLQVYWEWLVTHAERPGEGERREEMLSLATGRSWVMREQLCRARQRRGHLRATSRLSPHIGKPSHPRFAQRHTDAVVEGDDACRKSLMGVVKKEARASRLQINAAKQAPDKREQRKENEAQWIEWESIE
jgi:hypothetical protein